MLYCSFLAPGIQVGDRDHLQAEVRRVGQVGAADVAGADHADAGQG